MTKTYTIIRFSFNRPRAVTKTGLTLEEAQEHCSDPDTQSKTCSAEIAEANPGEWFDGGDYPTHLGCGGEIWGGKCHKCEQAVPGIRRRVRHD